VRHRFFLSIVIPAAIGAACGGRQEAADDPLRDGVNDVRLACQARRAWSPSPSETCFDCLGYAKVPSCACPRAQDFGGACEIEGTAQASNPDCVRAVADCVGACENDCDCVDRCYIGHDSCRKDTAALEGCVTRVCEVHCK
jgi:hypothetical protein